MNLIALDPANNCGWAVLDAAGVRSGVVNLEPAKAKKGKPDKPEKRHKRTGEVLRCMIPGTPAVDAEPDDERLVKFTRLLNHLSCSLAGWPFSARDTVVIHEAPLKHHAGVRAAQLAFWWQAAIALWCRPCVGPATRRVEVPPYDLQRHFLGRAATPGAYEMLEVAQARGYAGNNHNEADALLLLEWARVHVLGATRCAV